MCDAEIGVEKLAAFALNQIRFSVSRKNATSEHSHSYLVVIQILQRFFASALPDLHLPRLGDVGLPVDDSPLTAAPARRQRVQVERLVVRGAVHRAEHAAEFLPRPGGAVGAHALEEGWHFPGGRHAFSGWSLVGGGNPEFGSYFLLYQLVQPPPFGAQVDALQRKKKAHECCKKTVTLSSI